jgi:hypothetical protein
VSGTQERDETRAAKKKRRGRIASPQKYKKMFEGRTESKTKMKSEI